MTYEDLLRECDANNLVVIETQLSSHMGLIDENLILINKDSDELTKKCVLAEEMGHWFTTYGDILNQYDVREVKQEKLARRWAFEKLLSFETIVCALSKCNGDCYDASELLDVTKDFLMQALACFIRKQGIEKYAELCSGLSETETIVA